MKILIKWKVPEIIDSELSQECHEDMQFSSSDIQKHNIVLLCEIVNNILHTKIIKPWLGIHFKEFDHFTSIQYYSNHYYGTWFELTDPSEMVQFRLTYG